MRKLVVAIFVLVLGAATPAAAHPSENRNENGFGGPTAPHCHVVVAGQSNPAYPSHTGHSHAGNDVFLADPDCDGDAG
jgi:hypothetical protein